MFWNLIGLFAACLTSCAFIPQIFKALKTKSVKDVSPVTLFQLSLGVLLWIGYGLYLNNAIIIGANGFTLFCLIILLALYFKYGRQKR